MTAEGSASERTPANRVERFVDGCLDVGVAALALWTLLYWGALAGVPLVPLFALWVVGLVAIAWWRVRRPWISWVPASQGAQTWAVLATALAMAVLASVLSRPDGDDASFVARSTWTADRGGLPPGDFVFGEPGWPATFGSQPNVSSIEALFGIVAHVTGVATGDVVYRFVVPLATFAAVWALWVLLRAWRARRPVASVLLTLVFLLLGGYTNATWGNFFLGRIWQGKVVLVALLVPYLYACVAMVWRRARVSRTRDALDGRAVALVVTGLAGVGCSSTAVFLVPLIAGVTSLGLLVTKRWREALVVVVAASAGPVVAGVMTVLSPVGSRNAGGSEVVSPWVKVLGDERPIWALVAGVVLLVLAGALWPRWFAALQDRPVQVGLALAVVAGLLCTVPPLYSVLTTLTGGDAIAWRLAWVLPVPALVGLVASLPARRWGLPVVPAVALALVAILASAQPLWSAANNASIGRLGTWKVRDQSDLAAARWIVAQQPEGRYLAANWVAMMTGVLTSELRPVGTRMDYVTSLESLPDGQSQERALLQSIADGSARRPEDLAAATVALDQLDVEVAWGVWDDAFTQELVAETGFTTRYVAGPWTCRDRPTSG